MEQQNQDRGLLGQLIYQGKLPTMTVEIDQKSMTRMAVMLLLVGLVIVLAGAAARKLA